MKWVTNQLKSQNINAADLLFKIVEKDINVPNYISLHLIFKSLIKNEADLNSQTNNRWAPVHFAARFGNDEVLEFLFENGANLNMKNNLGRSHMHFAARYEHVEVLKFR